MTKSQGRQVKAQQTQTIMMMNGSARRFGASHPFWDEAISMRQRYFPYQDIVNRAHSLGYDDLTISTLRAGMHYAQSILLLPAHGGHYFQRMYARMAENFSALETLKHFVMDVLSELDEIDNELINNDTLGSEERQALRTRRDEIRALGYNWTKDLLGVEIQIEGVKVEKDAAERSHLDVNSFFEAMAQDWHQKLLAPPDSDQIIDVYGAENVRFPERLPLLLEDDAETS